MILYVSCYTKQYAEEAAGLIESLELFGLTHSVEEVPGKGNWSRNTKLKATYIRDKMTESPGVPIVWLDADARVRRDPVLFSTLNADMACYYRRDTELLSGTLFFSGSQAARSVVDQWIAANERRPGVFDQKNLQQVVEQNASNPEFRLERLPPAYCLFDLLVKHDKQITAPVIWHRQASRRLKEAVNESG